PRVERAGRVGELDGDLAEEEVGRLDGVGLVWGGGGEQLHDPAGVHGPKGGGDSGLGRRADEYHRWAVLEVGHAVGCYCREPERLGEGAAGGKRVDADGPGRSGRPGRLQLEEADLS